MPSTLLTILRRLSLLSSAIVAIAPVAPIAPAAAAQEPFDRAMVAKIRDEGLNRSHAWAMVDSLATVIGPRLTGSPAYLRAANWARDHFAAWGLSSPHLESWPFGRGWELEGFTLEMTAPRFAPLIGYPDAWSPSTAGTLEGTPLLIAGLSYDSLAAMRDRLRGAIVLTQPLMTNFIRQDRVNPTAPGVPEPATAAQAGRRGGSGGAAGARGQGRAGRGRGARGRGGRGGRAEAQRIAALLHEAGVGAVLKPSRGEHGTLFAQTRDAGANAVPTVVLAAESYNELIRLLQDHVPVRVRVNVKSHYITSDTSGYNVIAEIPGTDPRLRDEVVMIGGHLDSWHAATGAADNADGAATVLEAARILQAVGARPRRTIRFALWGGEEEGIFGSRAWVAQHLAGDANRTAREKMSLYLNIDPGYGPVYGFYMEGNAAAKAIFDAWMQPFSDLGYRRNVAAGIRNTDHLSFIDQGVPAFNPVQEYALYDVRIHHTNMDTMDRLNPDDVKQSAIVFATLAYNAAMRDAPIPRAPR